jgi:hypothetical protein
LNLGGEWEMCSGWGLITLVHEHFFIGHICFQVNTQPNKEEGEKEKTKRHIYTLRGKRRVDEFD